MCIRDRFEEASGGTLFLDETSEITPEHQVKLLRVIQEGEVKRVGENMQRKIDVRIIAATNRDLLTMVKSGAFREDLYYRICVMPIVVPPLRDRSSDILPLAIHFLERERAQSGKIVTGFTRSALDKVMAYSWPGNIRELENKVKQSLILSSGELIEEDEILLDEQMGSPSPPDKTAISRATAETAGPAGPLDAGDGRHETGGRTLNDARREFERRYLVGVLRKNRGNATMAAKEAGKHRSEFYYLLKKHGISPADFREESGA